jgi:hypothetical protein
LIASRPSSSTKKPTSGSPPEVITIDTDDEDEQIMIISPSKVCSNPDISTRYSNPSKNLADILYPVLSGIGKTKNVHEPALWSGCFVLECRNEE